MSATTEYLAGTAEKRLGYIKDVIDTRSRMTVMPDGLTFYTKDRVTLSYDLGVYGVTIGGMLGLDAESPDDTDPDFDENPGLIGDGILTFSKDLEIDWAGYNIKGGLGGEGIVAVTIDAPMVVEEPFRSAFVLMVARQVEAVIETEELA